MLRHPVPRIQRDAAPGDRPLAHRRHTTLRTPTLVLTLLVATMLASAGHAATLPPATLPPATLPPATVLPATVRADDVPAPHLSVAFDALSIAGSRVGTEDLARIAGGFCTTCSSGGSGGGGGGGTGTSGSPTASGTPYWSTYRVSLVSSSTTPASLVNQINNYSSQTINGTFEYTRKVVRDVQFSGGYANFVKASVGGEVSSSIRTSVTYPIAPRTAGKLYVKYRTDRQTYYGRLYQDFSDGTRTVVDSDSGPFLSTTTVLGYVTGAL